MMIRRLTLLIALVAACGSGQRTSSQSPAAPTTDVGTRWCSSTDGVAAGVYNGDQKCHARCQSNADCAHRGYVCRGESPNRSCVEARDDAMHDAIEQGVEYGR